MPRFTASSARFVRAFELAADWHGGQKKKASSAPYVSHLMAISSLVMEDGGTEDEAIAGLLHDVIEDCGAGYRESIKNEFGEIVLGIVEGCTDSDRIPKPPWRKRKEAWLSRLQEADESVCRVAVSDKLHNVRSMIADHQIVGKKLWLRFRGREEGTKWYYSEVSKILNRKLNSRNSLSLQKAVNQLNAL